MDKVRPHHYRFAHRVLPGIFFSNPSKFLQAYEEDGDIFIHFFWTHAAEDLGGDDVLSAEGLSAELIDDKVIVTLPEPKAITEAHFVGLSFKDKKPKVFTLEHSLDFATEEPCRVLGGWTDDGTHLNLGVRKIETTTEFAKAMEG